MESWRHVWREGIAPLLSTPGLEALRDALAADDPRLIQGITVEPECPAGVDHALDERCPDAACAVAYCGWRGDGLETVGQLDEFFARILIDADARLGEAAGTRHFLNWFDDAPRPLMRRALLREVERALDLRADPPAARAEALLEAV